MEENIKKALNLLKGKDTVSWFMFKQCIGSNSATNIVIPALIKAKFIFPTRESGIYKVNDGETYEIDYAQLGISKADYKQLPTNNKPATADYEQLTTNNKPTTQVSNPSAPMSGSTIELPPSDAGEELRITGFVFLVLSVICIMCTLCAENVWQEANYLPFAIYSLLVSVCCFVGAGLGKIAAYIQFYGTFLQNLSLDKFHNQAETVEERAVDHKIATSETNDNIFVTNQHYNTDIVIQEGTPEQNTTNSTANNKSNTGMHNNAPYFVVVLFMTLILVVLLIVGKEPN